MAVGDLVKTQVGDKTYAISEPSESKKVAYDLRDMPKYLS